MAKKKQDDIEVVEETTVAEQTIEAPEDRTKELEDRLRDMEDKYLLLCADFENYKKRMIKEKEDLRNNTKVSVLTAVLDIDNDIALAIKNIKDESAKEGVQLIAGKLETFLKSQGIETVQTETYDEDLHEVVTMLGEGKNVIDVISKGYTLAGKPFRYPKVVLG
jgi:molecular chaperone GrpE